jgi:hypothetical protein
MEELGIKKLLKKIIIFQCEVPLRERGHYMTDLVELAQTFVERMDVLGWEQQRK